MWHPKEINKGRHPDNQKIEFTFEYIGIKTPRYASGSCNCTDVKLEGNKITGHVAPKPVIDVVPAMVSKKEYNMEQQVTVLYDDNTHDVLKVKATIIPYE
jgi:hypothetical protein